MTLLATSSDLKQIPLRALVAYAARCARRVQRLYALDPAHPEVETCTLAIDGAISLAEGFAAGEEIDRDRAAQVEELAIRALLLTNELGAAPAAGYAANAAYAAVNATKGALEALASSDPAGMAEHVVHSATVAADSATSADEAVARAARLDWEMLHRMRLGNYPEAGEPINPRESGILGPLFCASRRTAPTAAPPAEPAEGNKRKSGKKGRSPAAATSEGDAADGANRNAEEAGARQSKKLRDTIAQIRAQKAILRAAESDFEIRRAAMQSEFEALQTERAQIREEQQRIREASHAVREEVLRRDAEMHHERQQLAELRAALDADQHRLHEERLQFEQDQVSQAELTRMRGIRNEVRPSDAEWGVAGDLEGSLLRAEERCAQLQADLRRVTDDHSEILCDRDRLEAECTRLKNEADGDALEAVMNERALLDARRAELEEREKILDQATRELERNQTTLAEEQQRFAAQSADFQARQEAWQKTADEFAAQRRRFDAEVAAHREEQASAENVLGESASAEAAELQEARQQVEAERHSLHGELEALCRRQTTLQEQEQQAAETAERLAAQQTQLQRAMEEFTARTRQDSEEQDRLTAERKALDAQRAALQEAEARLAADQGSLEAAGALLRETESNLARREAELQAAPRPSSTPQAAPSSSREAELLEELRQLEIERRQLIAERDQLATEVAVHRERDESQPDFPIANAKPRQDGAALRLLLQPGTCTPAELAELFGEFSALYQLLGGRGKPFEATDCRRPHDKGAKAAGPCVELRSSAGAANHDFRAASSLVAWEQLRSCLFMSLTFDATLAEAFDAGHASGAEQALQRAVASALQKGQSSSSSNGPVLDSRFRGVAIDGVHQQRLRVEEMLRSLGARHGLSLVLAPPAKTSETENPGNTKKKDAGNGNGNGNGSRDHAAVSQDARPSPSSKKRYFWSKMVLCMGLMCAGQVPCAGPAGVAAAQQPAS